MAAVLVTGISGTGKSTAVAELARRGHRVVDTDHGGYSEEVQCSGPGGWEAAVVGGSDRGVAQGMRPRGVFHLRLCLQPRDVLSGLPRSCAVDGSCERDPRTRRWSRDERVGKRDAERERILDDLAKVDPLLRAGASAEIDTGAPLDKVVDALEAIGDTVLSRMETSRLNEFPKP